MKNKKRRIYIVYLIIFIGVIIFSYVIATTVYYVPLSETTDASVSKDSNFNKQDEVTSKLKIPSIGVNANIQEVGLTKKGIMATPTNFFDVGLYKYGPQPGEKGSAVIDGHVDNGLGFKAVFGNLKKIKTGDDIYVEMKNGDNLHFVVKETSTYNFNDIAPEVFNQNDGYYLKLITCTGFWLKEFKTHNQRLVITATRVF